MAGMVQSLVTAETAVIGVCKPGAGLLGVVEGSQPPPPGSCSVLIAGANDIGAGRSSTIYQQLENQISMRTRTAKVMVSTVPYRHDLPPPTSCKGSVLLDFNAIGRRHFTRHGQHLTMRGKRMLAELVVAGLKKASLATDEIRNQKFFIHNHQD
ncbi:hypothetical protein J6590_098229 [Homalodisca vitripennis]|nr:hypothetical protein J6590_053205 [Homalodisca vitripennis]KAG8299548.1 hypothetical protein J6590_098229 [Homalodisca vitripennis]